MKIEKVKEITLSLFSFLLTITDVICWSRNTRIDAKIAGMADARIIHHGFFSLIGLMIQPRSGLVGCKIIEHVRFNYLIFIVYIVTRFLRNKFGKKKTSNLAWSVTDLEFWWNTQFGSRNTEQNVYKNHYDDGDQYSKISNSVSYLLKTENNIIRWLILYSLPNVVWWHHAETTNKGTNKVWKKSGVSEYLHTIGDCEGSQK